MTLRDNRCKALFNFKSKQKQMVFVLIYKKEGKKLLLTKQPM